MAFPATLTVVIEVPRGSFIKRDEKGRVDFISPFPCPFNYGSVPDTRSGDGDRLDAIVLGPALPRGRAVTQRVLGVVRFVDAGQDDPKYVCGEGDLASSARRLRLFFTFYAAAKRLLYVVRRQRGSPTHFVGIEAAPHCSAPDGVTM